MADLTRAEELVQAMERDDAFRSEVEAAPTVAAKRQVLDARGFGDVSLEAMKAYVESKGGKLVARPGGRELSDEELTAVAGGQTVYDPTIDVLGLPGSGGSAGSTGGAAAAAAV